MKNNLTLIIVGAIAMVVTPVEVLAIDPGNTTDQLLAVGESHYLEGNFTQAIEYYDDVLTIDPNNIGAIYDKGLALDALGRFEEAIPYYDILLSAQPDNVNALINKGGALADLGNYEEAIQNFDRALSIDPNNELASDNKELAESLLPGPIYFDINSKQSDVAAIRSTGIPFAEFIREIASIANSSIASPAQKAGFNDIKEHSYLYLYDSYKECQPESMILGTSGCDDFGSLVTEFCEGYLQVNPTEQRCSSTVMDGWQRYFDIRNLSEEEKDSSAWDRLEAVMSVNNPSR